MAAEPASAPAGGPLAGVRVVDFSWVVAGPQATRILADFGADVIRVEYEGRLDSIRSGVPVVPGPDGSGFFNNLNRNKRSITLNVIHPRGMELLHRLLKVADIVVENYRSRVLESWGLDYEAMARINPGIIYVSLSGFGHSGRDRDYITWGPTAQALSGLTYLSGLPGEPPAGWGYSYMDHTAGYSGAIAIMMALHHRAQTGVGQYVDISQVQSGMVLTGAATLDYTVNGRPSRREGNPPGNRSLNPAVAPHNTYRCAGNDRWVAIAVFDDAQWAGLCRAAGDPEWSRDPRFADNSGRVAHQDDLDRAVESWTRGRSPHEAMYALQAEGVPAGAVQNTEDKMEHGRCGFLAFHCQETENGAVPWTSSSIVVETQYAASPPLLNARDNINTDRDIRIDNGAGSNIRAVLPTVEVVERGGDAAYCVSTTTGTASFGKHRGPGSAANVQFSLGRDGRSGGERKRGGDGGGDAPCAVR
ncbi:MAG: CoA transferase [Chloroflexi bacterium]|nr:CoA transferase [Chloroflexota bacterium]